ncbi:DedA family protein [Ligilactobacillus sp. WILCCON 0076]|uniref:DedA family protein n=1 Tax=Ligilactobacillus ubinensis TaxID=2876789 RepID=A0A9X2FKY4_9LACO|nr:DedA family protein [Ligilactobacillus ubinensis]MCP0886641.1 DedA family protein [Ligilactobacillus ubinensis]
MNTTVLTDIINQYGYWGIAFLIAIENIFPPIPSEVVLAFTGFATTTTNLKILPSILAATIGAIIGALFLYALGRLISADRLEKWLAGRWGKILHLKPNDIKRAAAFFQRHGGVAVFFGRFVPVIRSLISIPAGMTGYPLPRFILLTTLGTLIWNTVLIWLGKLAGHAWPYFVSTFEVYGKIFLLFVIITFLITWIIYKRKSK